MNLFRSAVVVVVVTGIAVTAMLLVRRHAPEGSYFTDGDRASGVFGVLASGFAILLGFIVFLAFTSYDQSRAGAETEALTVAQQAETAQFFAPPVAGTLTGELVCYARSVVDSEWQRMGDGVLDTRPNPWAIRLFRTIRTVEPQTDVEGSAFDKWLDQTSTREQARQDRIHGAVGVIPSPLWVVLFVISFIIFGYMLFFADRGEGALTQALLMGCVVAVIVMLLLLLRFLDNPYHSGTGALRPVAMERTVRILDHAIAKVGVSADELCDARGVAA